MRNIDQPGIHLETDSPAENWIGQTQLAFANHAKVRGRGTLENPTGRFESIEIVYDSDDPESADELKTRFFQDHTKTIVASNDSPDVCFRFSINPYRGCEHGCIYCFARPTHEYFGLSCGLDFESKIMVKLNAAKLLRQKLSSKRWEPQPIILSGVTDPYQPVERRLEITRQCLQVLAEFRNPVGIITKNALITRDIDMLSELSKYNAVRVMISVTTLDAKLAAVMEPRASSPAMRLQAIRKLSDAGIPVHVIMGPLIPGLTDQEINSILQHAAESGAQSASYVMLRLPYGVKNLFETWLQTHFPERKNRVLNRIRDVRGGTLYNADFGSRLRGEGAYADYIERMFTLAKKRYGLYRESSGLSTEFFRNPALEADSRQMRLF
jgi:DNA repair photolyase